MSCSSLLTSKSKKFLQYPVTAVFVGFAKRGDPLVCLKPAPFTAMTSRESPEADKLVIS
uniref:Uncharacterized protein n=1 Tax=Haemonchus placei TaxID=6290 RepID=A0A0N4X716_HAEPC